MMDLQKWSTHYKSSMEIESGGSNASPIPLSNSDQQFERSSVIAFQPHGACRALGFTLTGKQQTKCSASLRLEYALIEYEKWFVVPTFASSTNTMLVWNDRLVDLDSTSISCLRSPTYCSKITCWD